jgi:hypothetical protein
MSDTYIPSSLRRLVHERARDCCEYCWIPQAAVFATPEVDHIFSEKHGVLQMLITLRFPVFCVTNTRAAIYPHWIPTQAKLFRSIIHAEIAGLIIFNYAVHGSFLLHQQAVRLSNSCNSIIRTALKSASFSLLPEYSTYPLCKNRAFKIFLDKGFSVC